MPSIWKITVPLLALFSAVLSGRMLGESTDANLRDLSVQEALQFATVQYNQQNEATYVSRFTRIIKAKQQVIDGIIYTFTVEVSKTVCTQMEDLRNKPCPAHENPDTKECVFKVWHKAVSPMTLEKMTCQ